MEYFQRHRSVDFTAQQHDIEGGCNRDSVSGYSKIPVLGFLPTVFTQVTFAIFCMWNIINHDDVINWKHSTHYWLSVRELTGHW